ncbi:MAG: tRNA (guanosine(46)-N7)-methyltransferase TrmB [Clostridiales Family XIII bacterium]|jgi:tRNA (guanine-N7-)-methyltransferase|nr:tRNA (guanosine(46)-N7)-methyltransferase TrmB [Clostridiales Family XIII bacterium]
MRQRNIKDIEYKLAEHDRLLITEPAEKRGVWRQSFDHGQAGGSANGIPRLYLELGCGKGRFICETAARDPAGAYIGVEGQQSVMYRALVNAEERELPNLLFCPCYIREMDMYFAESELLGIYLNFSDPWPKARHEKRRLTAPGYLAGYLHALEAGGFLRVKTDNDDFFAYSRTGIEAMPGFEIVECTDDLHRSAYGRGNVMTEYEHKFLNIGRRIKYLFARRR